ncbi:hypothetical protein, partial [Asanoa siamensis]|uniref:hypothetical protein n=1 Tax=Asanoa siamensis TaxID=926357 RepID=UPI0019452A36
STVLESGTRRGTFLSWTMPDSVWHQVVVRGVVGSHGAAQPRSGDLDRRNVSVLAPSPFYTGLRPEGVGHAGAAEDARDGEGGGQNWLVALLQGQTHQ